MDQRLIFRFSGPDQVEWLTSADTEVHTGALADLARYVTGRRPVLAAPGEAVLLSWASVPGRHRAAWLKAIPYALEEGLADDVETLHFAPGEAQADKRIPVAVVRHEALRTWLEDCHQAGIVLTAVIPDFLLLPLEEGAWSLLIEDDRAVVRTGPWSGFALEQDELSLLLNLALAEAESPPRCLKIWGTVEPEMIATGIEIHRQNSPPEPLRVFAEGFDPKTTLNLLQGPYGRSAQLSRWLRPWRAAAILAGLWLGLQLVLEINEYGQLRREGTALRMEMERIFREAVPDARRIVNPRVQLENRLQALRGGEDASPETAFLDLLYQGAQPLTTFEGITLKGLRYRNEQLDLDLEGDSLEILDRLRQRFGEHTQLQVQMRTTKREGKVESQVTLTKATS